MKLYNVYILASRSRVLYTGVTADLERRTLQHVYSDLPGFTSRYHVDRLVYVEQFTEITQAIAREKQIKSWSRRKKIALIESANPQWTDLAADLPHPVR
jgi:Predicted endonuclease containing a URI domain